MKTFGAISIGIGLALIIFFVVQYRNTGKEILSPIPENNSVKVIYISPTK